MKTGIITFPGSNCDKDVGFILEKYFSHKIEYLWHKDHFENNFDLIVLPGGFSYGDYLRCGALARFAVAMESLNAHIKSGKLVLGICNGFQILVEANLLPGALTLNKTLKHICKTVTLVKGSEKNPLTNKIPIDSILEIPVSHSEGSYFAGEDTIKKLRDENCILFQYALENPNGSVANIAGVSSRNFKIAGLMPHPERAVEEFSGSRDGKIIFESFFERV
ncbi:MAG: phosphoribosylformylglycinamidine synthase subunit PurQ [Leptospiraceae bacterium]|nr:phosphoribosylformylglycinamidine synthase subunit PurQ [Leptospiraceae bacterium]MCP5495042.1 phosphoribosylformylglycinamidine synthase subunit PurQ [Leptospiraceae bacterium]